MSSVLFEGGDLQVSVYANGLDECVVCGRAERRMIQLTLGAAYRPVCKRCIGLLALAAATETEFTELVTLEVQP